MWVQHHPFLAGPSGNVDDLSTDAVVRLLQTGGVEQVSMSAVARLERVTPAAVNQRHGGRAAFLDAVIGRFSVRWIDWVTRGGYLRVVPVRLPEDADECAGVRAWELLRALAEGEARAGRPACAGYVAEAEAAEREHVVQHLSARLDRQPTTDEVETIMLLADGVRRRMTQGELRLVLADAQRLLRDHMANAFGLAPDSLDLSSDQDEEWAV